MSTLTKRQMHSLWKRKMQGDVFARKQLLELYYPVVSKVVGKMMRNFPPHVDFQELVSYGMLGLIRAVDGFNPHAGTPFGPYLSTAIKSCVLDELRKQDWAPRSLRRRQREITTARHEVETELGRTPSEQEVADHLSTTTFELSEVARRVDASYHRSLDELLEKVDPAGSSWEEDDSRGSAMDPATEDEIDDEKPRNLDEDFLSMSRSLDTEESVSLWEVGARLIQTLPVRQQMVLAFSYIERASNRDIAALLCIKESKVGQLHTEAVLALREALAQGQEAS